MFLGIDPLYWFMMIPVFLLSAIAQISIKTTFSKYSKIANKTGITGAQAAREILNLNGLTNISVTETRGFLSDHYDPVKKVVRLSPAVYRSRSIAAVGVAAHESGHAIQHAKAYAPLTLRNIMVPLATIGSNIAWIVIIGGFVLGFLGLVKFGVILFSVVVFFQLLNLPVEFNASRRAKKILLNTGIVNQREINGVKQVLSSAALTYVAAAATSILTLLYFLLRSGLLGGRR